MPTWKICGACGGNTWCFNCGGSGKIGKWVTDRCTVCKGKKNCPRCGGKGKVRS